MASAFADSGGAVERPSPSKSHHRLLGSKPPPPQLNRGFPVALSRRKMASMEDERPGREAIDTTALGSWEHQKGRAAATGVSMAFLDADTQKRRTASPGSKVAPTPPLHGAKGQPAVSPAAKKPVAPRSVSGPSVLGAQRAKPAVNKPAVKKSKPTALKAKPAVDMPIGSSARASVGSPATISATMPQRQPGGAPAAVPPAAPATQPRFVASAVGVAPADAQRMVAEPAATPAASTTPRPPALPAVTPNVKPAALLEVRTTAKPAPSHVTPLAAKPRPPPIGTSEVPLKAEPKAALPQVSPAPQRPPDAGPSAEPSVPPTAEPAKRQAATPVTTLGAAPAAFVGLKVSDASTVPASEAMPNRATDDGEASVLAQAAALRSSGKRAGEEGQWSEAGELYSQACELLLMMGAADSAVHGGADGARGTRGEPVAAELQKCRLSLSLCLGKQKRWRDVVETCSAIIDANARCGTAWFRRGQALAALGEAEAAVWDLRRASSLLPANAQVQRALIRAQAAGHERKAALSGAGAGFPFGDLFGLGGDSGTSSLSSLLGSGGAAGSGSGAGGAGGLLSLMSGMGAAKPGGQSEGLEALLESPFLASMGGAGSSASMLIGFAKRALALRRRAKQLWLTIKPYLPLLFYLVLLLPTVIAVWQGRLKLWPF